MAPIADNRSNLRIACSLGCLMLAGCGNSGRTHQAPAGHQGSSDGTGDAGADAGIGNGLPAVDAGLGTAGAGGMQADAGTPFDAGTKADAGGHSKADAGPTQRACRAPAPCDVTQSTCQLAVLELAACVRESDVPPQPPVRTISSQQLRDELQAKAEAMGLSPSPWDTALIRLGLLAPETTIADAAVALETQSVAAYYERGAQRITLVDSNLPDDDATRMELLAHELTHYMQDLEVGLDALRADYAASSDQNNAATALIEGEATVTATRALARITDMDPAHIDWSGMTDSMLSDMLVHVASSDAALYAANETLPYPVGVRYVSDAWNHGGRGAVDTLFAHAPAALIDWISGYDGSGGTGSLAEKLDCGLPPPPDGFVTWSSDSLGAAGALALLSVTAGQTDTTEDDFALAAKLRGDQLSTYATAPGKDAPRSPVVVAWRLRFSDEAAAQAFQARAAMLDLTTRTFGRELLLTGGDVDNPLSGDVLDACPAPQDLMPPPAEGIVAASRRLPGVTR